MAATERQERELKEKSLKAMKTAKDPIELLRARCLARGTAGICGFARLFKIMDDDHIRLLSFNEFKKVITEFGFSYTNQELKNIFNQFDTDNSGSIDFDEFLLKLRPPMNKFRIDLINKAFIKLDKNSDGKIQIADLKGVFNVNKHPKFINGEWSEDQILGVFLDSFDTKGSKDGIVTRDEFINYYAGVSASIDNDVYFDLMMRQAWKLN